MKPSVVIWLSALVGCALTIVTAVLGAGYDARATFTREPLHYLPLAVLILILAGVFTWRFLQARARND